MTATLERHRPFRLNEVMASRTSWTAYDRQYFGNLHEAEAKRVGIARREGAERQRVLLHEQRYVFYACSRDGYIFPVTALDRGSSKDRESDFLALPSETANAFVEKISGNDA